MMLLAAVPTTMPAKVSVALPFGWSKTMASVIPRTSTNHEII